MKRFPLLLISLLAASSASAHVGIGPTTGAVAGFSHPFSGIDHITTMIAVGLWAATKGGKALWVWPMTFVAAMIVGGALGLLHVPIPFVEPGILASVVILGLLVATAADLPVGAGAAIITVFAVLHGHAHGAEAPQSEGGLLYLGGFAIATAILHVVGIGVAMLAGARFQAITRLAGAISAAIGLGLITGVL